MSAVIPAIIALFSFLGQLLGFIQKRQEASPGNATVDEAIASRKIDDEVRDLDMAALKRQYDGLHSRGK